MRPLPHPDVVVQAVRLEWLPSFGLAVVGKEPQGAPVQVVCHKCGTAWDLPTDPFPWAWLICSKRCNLPRTKPGIREMLARVGGSP